MPRFFCTQVGESTAVITGEDARHISKVLRMRKGDTLTLCNTQGRDFLCRIETLSPEEVTLSVLESRPSDTEPDVFVRLYQGLPKGDKLELIIQKAVELGVSEIVPVAARRCVARLDDRSQEKKLARYQRIAYEAAKQCGRGIIPAVKPPVTFVQAVKQAESDLSILFYENSSSPLREALSQPAKTISILVGPEGGFDPEEVQLALEKGWESLSLGKRILRCETAPLAALAIVMYQTGNL